MQKIEVAVLNESSSSPAGIMMFLARLTQRGHNIHSMSDLVKLYENSTGKHKTAAVLANLPHGTIKRFTPITIAIVGASRRFLAQARTHQVGMNYVSASLQYSDYSGKADFVVPYALTEASKRDNINYAEEYQHDCLKAMQSYEAIARITDNDTAGYIAPQGLRNILIMQANHEAWRYFISLRGCNRNTAETQYVTMRIWEELLKTADGEEMFSCVGPDCAYGMCREGKMGCGDSLKSIVDAAHSSEASVPRCIIDAKWPMLHSVLLKDEPLKDEPLTGGN